MNNITTVIKNGLRVLLISYVSIAFSGNVVENESLYQLQLDLTDQNNREIPLNVYQGQPTLIAMFYAHCPYACPLTINILQRTLSELEPKQQKQLRVLLVSLDPVGDTTELLAKIVKKHKIDASRWTLARTDTTSVRKLAAVLGIRFRKLPDGEFNHSTIITLLNDKGVPVTRSNQLATIDPILLAALRELVISQQ